MSQCLPGFAVQLLQPRQQGRRHLRFQFGVAQVVQRAPGQRQQPLAGFALQRLPLILLLSHQFRPPAFSRFIHFGPRLGQPELSLRGDFLPRPRQLGFPMGRQFLLAHQIVALQGFGFGGFQLRFRQRGSDALLAGGHCGENRAIQKPLEQPQQQQEIADLGGDGEPVQFHA